MGAKTYRESPIKLIASLVIDLCLMIVFIGFITAPAHILEFLKKSLSLSENGILLTKGVLSTTTIEIPYAKINSITVRRGVLGKILGYGDVVILSGNDSQGIPFAGVENPEQLKAEIMSMVNKN